MDTLLNDFGQSSDFGSLDGEAAVRTHQTPEKHLDAAITTSLLSRLKTAIDGAYQETPGFNKFGQCGKREQVLLQYFRRHPEIQYSSFQRYLTSYSRSVAYCDQEPIILEASVYPFYFNRSGRTDVRTGRQAFLAQSAYEVELNAYLAHVKDVVKPAHFAQLRETLLCRFSDTEVVSLHAERAETWSIIVDDYRSQYGKGRRPKPIRRGNLLIIHGEGFALLRHLTQQTWHLATYEQLQMIQDSLLARSSVYTALQFNFHNGTASLPNFVQRILQWQESVLREYGNDGYDLVKAPEAIFKTRLTSLTNGDVLEYSSFERTVDKIKLKEVKLISDNPLNLDNLRGDLTEQLVALAEDVYDVHDAAELFGLTKLSGHPSVYADKSAASVLKEIRKPTTVSHFHLIQVTRVAKHLLLSGYIRRHGDWPPFICPPPSDTLLGRHYRNKVSSLPMNSYQLWELDTIQFGKFIEYDYSDDYLKFLDDKAICPGARDMAKFWFQGPSEPRRLLQKILEMPEFDTRALVERLRLGNFLQDELVVELTQKEREFKIAARCFAKLPFLIRTFFTLNEYNLKEHCLKHYVPHQTMTMSNAEEKRRLYALVRDAKRRNKCLVEGDYSRWNLAMRAETVNPTGQLLNDVFGLPGVFTQVHYFFEKATCVVTDKHWLPAGADPSKPITEWPESDVVWRNHVGGFEGLAQAYWTFFTIAMAIAATLDLNVSFNMAAQGDNVIFAFTFNDTTVSIPDQLRRLLAHMEVMSRWVNHEVKPEECIDSYTVLTYSKELYVDSAHVLYNLKFASRSFRRDEIDVPSLSKEVASTSAIAMACADSIELTPKAMFWRHWLLAAVALYRIRAPFYVAESRHLRVLTSSKEKWLFFSLLPGSLGGLPTMPWTRFFMKGEVDDLSWDVAGVCAMQQYFPLIGSDLRHLLRGDYSPSHPDLTQLLLDPHSIPILRPKDQARLIKDEVAFALPGITKNVAIKELITHANSTADRRLQDALISMRPFYPQIAADIYKFSPSGVRDSLLGRFIMTRTLTRITNSSRFTHAIEQSSADMLAAILTRFKLAKEQFLGLTTISPYEVCKKLRLLWGSHVDHKCIGVYTPFEFQLKHCKSSASRITAHTRSPNDDSILNEAGPYPPNFGTKTRSKQTSHGFRLITSSSTVADLKRLVLTWSELGSSSALAGVLNQIALARSPWTVEQLSHVLPTSYGGSAAHRHESLDARHFAVLGSKTTPTHINFCSDNAGILSGGEFDVPIAFQPFYLTLTCIIQVLAAAKVNVASTELSYVLTDEYESLPEEPVTAKLSGPIHWKVSPGNPLAYVSDLQVSHIPLTPPKSLAQPVQPVHVKPSDLIYSVLLNRYGTQFVKLINSTAVIAPIDIFDLKEFNRINFQQLVRGVSFFCQALAANAIIENARHSEEQRFLGALSSACHGCAGLLSRLLAHPSNCLTKFAATQGIRFKPGPLGAIHAAQQLGGYLLEWSLASLRSQEALAASLNLVLFDNCSQKGVATMRMHTYFLTSLHFQQPHRITYLSSYNKMVFIQALYSGMLTQSHIFKIAALAAAYEQVTSSSKHPSAQKTIKCPLQYCNSSPELAMRALRGLHTDVRVPVSADPPLFSDNARRVRKRRFKHLNVEGQLGVKCDCTPDPIDKINVNRFFMNAERPRGRYAGAVSVWYCIFEALKGNVRRQRVVTIGVGHGAAARAALDLQAASVEGIDLRSSFPISSQREGVYKPPEILDSGRANDFCWNEAVAEVGGDASVPGAWLNTLSDATVVLDIEKDWKFEYEILKNLRTAGVVMWRTAVCPHALQWIINAAQPSAVYCLETTSLLCKQSHLIVFLDGVIAADQGNWAAVELDTAPLWRSTLSHKSNDVLDIFNDLIRPAGYQMKSLTTSGLLEISRSIHRDSLNEDNHLSQARLNKLSQLLNTIVRVFNDPASEIPLQSDREVVRLVGRWYSSLPVLRDSLRASSDIGL